MSWSGPLRRAAAGAVLAIGLVGAVAPRGAAAEALLLRSASDGASPSLEQLADQAERVRDTCVTKPVPLKPMSGPRAIARIEARLRRAESVQALSGFARSAAARTPAGARRMAAIGVVAGRPGAAMAALVRLHRLRPRDPGPLIDLAAVVTAQGMAREGLALLDQAGHLKAKGPAPMGVSWNAIALNNRGYALLRLGRPAAARPLLAKAGALAPELAEARENLAAADQCRWAAGGGGGAPPVIADPPFDRDPTPASVTTDPSGDPVPVASSFLDLSESREWTPIFVRIAESPQEGAGMDDYYQQLSTKINDRIVANSQRMGSLVPAATNDLTSKRRSAIYAALNTAAWQPELRPLDEAFNAAEAALQAGNIMSGRLDPSRPFLEAVQGCPDGDMACWRSVCTARTTEFFAQWRPLIAAANDADLRYEAAFWKYATGVAANVADPATHEQMLLDAESTMLARRYNVVNAAMLWNRLALVVYPELCAGVPAPPADQANVADQNGSDPCPPGLKGVKVTAKLSDIVSVALSCEKIEVEVRTPGPVGAFASASTNPRTGQTTIFAGGRMGGSVGVGATGKVGAFVTVGPAGVSDAGMRVSGSASVDVPGTGGGGSISASFTQDFGLAGSVVWPR